MGLWICDVSQTLPRLYDMHGKTELCLSAFQFVLLARSPVNVVKALPARLDLQTVHHYETRIPPSCQYMYNCMNTV